MLIGSLNDQVPSEPQNALRLPENLDGFNTFILTLTLGKRRLGLGGQD